jgi:hypothetical protein
LVRDARGERLGDDQWWDARLVRGRGVPGVTRIRIAGNHCERIAESVDGIEKLEERRPEVGRTTLVF